MRSLLFAVLVILGTFVLALSAKEHTKGEPITQAENEGSSDIAQDGRGKRAANIKIGLLSKINFRQRLQNENGKTLQQKLQNGTDKTLQQKPKREEGLISKTLRQRLQNGTGTTLPPKPKKEKECPNGWTVVGKKCVKAFKKIVKGLYAANKICKKYKGYVVTINNEDENKAIARLLKEVGKSMVIGLTDGIKEGDFVWYNGKKATYKNFKEPAPDNRRNQDCVVMDTKGKWNDLWCHWKFRGVVCQIDMPVNTCDDGTRKCEKFYKVEDVAKGKEATQSSSRNRRVAKFALNNNWDSCTHTKKDNNPWWKVDLKQSYKIETIVLVNRQDCCGYRLKNLVITVGESEKDMKDCVKYEGPAETTEVLELRCTSPLKGTFVKIEIKGTGYLTLCQVMINVFKE